MKGILLLVILLLFGCGGTAVPSLTAVPPTPIPTPANPPTIDGILSPNEWDNAETAALSDGSELLMMQDNDYLFLAIRSVTPEMIGANVFVENDGQIMVLHTSAALGTAVSHQTILSGTVADQAALHSLLTKIRDLGLPLVSVNLVSSDVELLE